MSVKYRSTASVTVPSSSVHVSDAADLHDYRLKGIQMSSAWSSAVVTFQGSLDGATYYDIYNDAGTQLSISAAALEMVALGSSAGTMLAGFNYLKLRSGLSSAGDEQAGARVLTLILMPASAG